jgi:phospholipid/cholesterol/gamma-HCH transport system permease protein
VSQAPSLQIDAEKILLLGNWTLAAMLPNLAELQASIEAQRQANVLWDLNGVERLDSSAAILLWRAWGENWPARLLVDAEHRHALQRIAEMPVPDKTLGKYPHKPVLFPVLHKIWANLQGVLVVFGQLLLDIAHLFRHPADTPWRELTANIYKSGAQALPVTALVGFLIGITLSYLSALQLKSFGADLLIVNILGISIIRELGPVLVAVLVAGRSGSAMTAQIGVMRVTEEIDALHTMGISRSVRVVLPKIIGLTAVMPLLVLWLSAMALLGGMIAAMLQLDLSIAYFIDNMPRTVPVSNLVIGLSKGVVFGFLISLLACHYGLKVRPNTESLAANTTSSVVTAITTVILFDAVFAILTRNIGVPT